jgi:hypothetical protein
MRMFLESFFIPGAVVCKMVIALQPCMLFEWMKIILPRGIEGYTRVPEYARAAACTILALRLIVRASLGSVSRPPWLTAGQETVRACACI